MHKEIQQAKIFLSVLLLLSGAAVSAGQSPLPLPTASPKADASPAGAATQQLEGTEEPLVYGLQAVLIETVDGKTVSAQAADQAFNPASSIKLGLALVALHNFGPQYRFTNGFWTDGTINKITGELNGNLYVTGRDPSFHYEHAVMIARLLNNLGVRSISGHLVVAPGFTMNFSSSARRSGELLYDTLDASRRSGEATRAWMYERMALGDQSSLQTVPSVAVMGDVMVGSATSGAKLILTHNSSRLIDVLKVLLCYSNNFMAERIGDGLGGAQSVRRWIISLVGVAENEIQLSSVSGLGINRVTPRAMMKIFRGLRNELQKNKLTPADIMPVAGMDPGTLEERFTGPAWEGSVIAKTGTLVRTDGGASSLVGQMKTASGVLLFVIMNQRGSVLRFRQNQDNLVMQVQNSRGGPVSFGYKPRVLAMKLADTQSVSASANEFEPNLKNGTSPP
ncbi:MAG TPA: D-alanyl-D-alanine carboxypeptidase [Pyrinomonadaceae bacterium]|nr:D-alanyl-D-alanine carboxypeptidase [Pyrinomonadaceae bacterium]